MTKRVLFYCQHVLGMGHLVRSAAIVRALAERFSVLFAIGGEMAEGFRVPPGVQLVRLAALQTGADFGELQVCDGSLSLEEAKALRCEQLLNAFDAFAPDVLITELFPFGRKQFGFELIPLLERAKRRGTAVACSVRDVLVTKQDQAKHEQRVAEQINRYYDLVLVHGDQRFIRLDETFSRLGLFTCAVQYTGYVTDGGEAGAGAAEPGGEGAAQPTIVASNGGGRCESGHVLLEGTIRAAQDLAVELPHQFEIFAGPFMPGEVYERLQCLAGAAANVRLSRFTPDLGSYLRRADLSISMGGYNTIMDVLRSGVRALVYPETANGDREQNIRTNKLAELGAVEVLDNGTLEAHGLAGAVRLALRKTPCRPALDLGGAQNTARLLQAFLAMRAAPVKRMAATCLAGYVPGNLHTPSRWTSPLGEPRAF